MAFVTVYKDKFKVIKNTNSLYPGAKFMSFFIYDGKVYDIGADVYLSVRGSQKMFHPASAKLSDHFFQNGVERWIFKLNHFDYDVCNTFKETDDFKLSDCITSVSAEPIECDINEYLEYMEGLKNGTIDNGPNKVLPVYKDWQLPEVIMGWVAFILVCWLVGIFKDWYIQWIIRVFAAFRFFKWRHKKLYALP